MDTKLPTGPSAKTTRVRFTRVSLCALILLSGCGTSRTSTDSTGSVRASAPGQETSETTPSASVSKSTSLGGGPQKPRSHSYDPGNVKPKGYRSDGTKGGAQRFARQYLAAVNSAYTTGNPRPLFGYAGPTCTNHCDVPLEKSEALRQKGLHVEDSFLEKVKLKSASKSNARYIFTYSYDYSNFQIVDGETVVSTYPSSRGGATLFVESVGGEWVIADALWSPYAAR